MISLKSSQVMEICNWDEILLMTWIVSTLLVVVLGLGMIILIIKND